MRIGIVPSIQCVTKSMRTPQRRSLFRASGLLSTRAREAGPSMSPPPECASGMRAPELRHVSTGTRKSVADCSPPNYGQTRSPEQTMRQPYMLLQTLLLLTAALGCFQTQSKVMESWMGQPGDRLIQSWGAPDRSEALSDGTRVLTWVSVWADQQGQATCRKSFTLNKGGTVEKWSFSGCPTIWIEPPW